MKKIKVCPYCKNIIKKINKKCPICKNYLYTSVKNFAELDKGRNKKILNLLNSGDFTLMEIGKKYNLTRERIRQIYAGHYSVHLKKNRNKKQEALLIKLNSFKFNCAICHKSITYGESKGYFKYCKTCSVIVKKTRRFATNKKYYCDNCGVEFFPIYIQRVNYHGKHNHIFHSQACYGQWQRKKNNGLF